MKPIKQVMDSLAKRQSEKADRKRREEVIKNAHLKIYNQASKKPISTKHMPKSSIMSTENVISKAPLANKRDTNATIATSDNVSEQIKRLTRKEESEQKLDLAEEGKNSRNLGI